MQVGPRRGWSSHVLPEDQLLAQGLLVNDSGLLQVTLVPSQLHVQLLSTQMFAIEGIGWPTLLLAL